MRVVVALLVAVNLLFFGWTQGYFGSTADPDALRIKQQLLADQVRIVARDEPPSEPARSEKTGKAVEKSAERTVEKTAERTAASVCLVLGDLPAADAEQLEASLAEKFPAFRSVRTSVAGSFSYWVSIPPLATKQELDAKVAELKNLGLADFYVVQESGPNNRAISLGLFSRKDAANVHLEALRAKGVKSARVVERILKPALATLELRGPEAQADALRQALAEALPESRPTACRTPAAQ
jgi:hypothetical protein